MNVDIIWSNFLNQIKDELSSLAYETWFKETKLHKLEDGKAIIIVPFDIHKDHLKKYEDLIVSNLNKLTGSDYELKFLLSDEIEEDNRKTEAIRENIIIDNKINDNVNSNLIKKYSFETFIVGNTNKFAHAAALSVAENPGNMYNPLFLYGNSGLGKTHLMHAIGNYIVENSNKRVLYVSSEQFRDDYTSATRKNDDGENFTYMDFFKEKYRNIDVLLIDDIQYLKGAPKTQEAFFHTFNNLYNDSKQIIISSDRSPDDLNILEDRFKTRFNWGLQVNIYPPDFSLKKEILKKKIIANDFQNEINEDVIDYIANNIGPDVRKLEGSINRLIAYAAMMGRTEINLDLAIESLTEFVSRGMGEKNEIQRIQRIVAEHFQITVEDIRSKKRSANISFPRQIAMYLCRTMTDESFPKIGIEFGGKDHSTVMFSVEKIENEIKINKDLANIIEKLKKDIGVV